MAPKATGAPAPAGAAASTLARFAAESGSATAAVEKNKHDKSEGANEHKKYEMSELASVQVKSQVRV
jgi:hypothetical protein